MIKELDNKINKIKNKMEQDATEQNKKLEQQRIEIKALEEEKETLRLDLLKSIKKLFKGIVPNISVDEYGVKIRLQSDKEVYILDHLYKGTAFEIIDRKLAYKIVELYEQVYGEPKEKKGFTLSSLGSLNTGVYDVQAEYATSSISNNY